MKNRGLTQLYYEIRFYYNGISIRKSIFILSFQ